MRSTRRAPRRLTYDPNPALLTAKISQTVQLANSTKKVNLKSKKVFVSVTTRVTTHVYAPHIPRPGDFVPSMLYFT